MCPCEECVVRPMCKTLCDDLTRYIANNVRPAYLFLTSCEEIAKGIRNDTYMLTKDGRYLSSRWKK